MKPYTRTILNLFDGKKRYLIPLYQRQYAWKVSPQLEMLWADLERAADQLEAEGHAKAPHFMGAMVIALITTYGQQVQAYEVIDGQQRLTTFQLLMCAVRDVARDLAPDYEAEVATYLINKGIMETPEVERYKLWPSLVDRLAFTRIVDPDGVGAPREVVAAEEADEARPAMAAYAYFVAQVRRRVCPEGVFRPTRLEKLFEAMKDGLAVVSIELEGGDDPQTIFETLNSRGVDLSAGDLMRNFIFQRAVGMGQAGGSLVADQLYRTYWLPLDGWFWRQEETRGRLTRTRLDWMLVDHLQMQLADLVSAERVFETYRAWQINDAHYTSIEAELKTIASSAGVYRRLLERNSSDPISRFGAVARAFDVGTMTPLLIYLATEAELGDALPGALALLESYIVRRDLCGLTTKNYNRQFVDLVKRLRSAAGDKVAALASLLQVGRTDISRWPEDSELQAAWLGRAQYKNARQPRLRHLLEAIEAAKRGAKNEVVEIKSDLTVEHIMPQDWRTNWGFGRECWVDDELDVEVLEMERRRETAVNLLGNLTLLTSSLNSSVSNGAFEVKMPALREQSGLALNRELNAFATWNEETIAKRGADLFEVARRLWCGPSDKTLAGA